MLALARKNVASRNIIAFVKDVNVYNRI